MMTFIPEKKIKLTILRAILAHIQDIGILFQLIIDFVGDRFQPFVRLFPTRLDVGGQVLEP